MKNLKQTASLLLVLAMLLTAFVGCAAQTANTTTDTTTASNSGTAAATTAPTEAPADTAAEKKDSDVIREKGMLIVGITEFEPMDYVGENGEWIGFDADLSRLFAESLGVTCEFVVVDWDNKTMELDAGNIDCVWNGMTLTDGVKAAMETTKAYCGNAQVIVAPKDMAEGLDYATLTFAVEAGSAAEELAADNGWTVVAMQSQGDALLEVASGTSAACIIDRLMANALTGEGTSYPDLVLVEELNEEEYGVGFRKGSDLAAALDMFFDAKFADGTMTALGELYGVDVIAR